MYITNYRGLRYFAENFTEHCVLAVAFFLPLSLTVASVFLAAGAVVWLGKMVVNRRLVFKYTVLDPFIAVFVVWAGLSIVVSPDPEFSFYNYYHLMGRYILLYYFFINNLNSAGQLKKTVWALLGSAMTVVIYGFYQYLAGTGVSSLEWVDGEQFPDLKFRVYSTLQNPNLLAGFLVMIIPVVIGLGCRIKKIPVKIFLFAATLALSLCLVFTYSRGAWISVLTVICVYGLFYNRRILWCLLLVPVVIMGTHHALSERLISIVNPTDTSSTLRLALWESTVAMIADHPGLGIGWGAYWLVYPDYDFFVQDANTKIVHAHNMYLNLAAEIGLPGLAAFLGIIVGHIKLALTAFKNSRTDWLAGLMIGIAAALLGLAVGGITDYVLFNTQLAMLFWLLNALAITGAMLTLPGINRQKIYPVKDARKFAMKSRIFRS